MMQSEAFQPHFALAAPMAPILTKHAHVVSDWIVLNQAVLIDYWEERIYTDELLRRLQRLP